jgi:ABC-2 type transporter
MFVSSTFFVFIFSLALTMKAWFRAVAAAFDDPAPAQTVAGILLLGLVLYTGYTIPKPSMIGALRWITWVNVRLPCVVHCYALHFCSLCDMDLKVSW